MIKSTKTIKQPLKYNRSSFNLLLWQLSGGRRREKKRKGLTGRAPGMLKCPPAVTLIEMKHVSF